LKEQPRDAMFASMIRKLYSEAEALL